MASASSQKPIATSNDTIQAQQENHYHRRHHHRNGNGSATSGPTPSEISVSASLISTASTVSTGSVDSLSQPTQPPSILINPTASQSDSSSSTVANHMNTTIDESDIGSTTSIPDNYSLNSEASVNTILTFNNNETNNDGGLSVWTLNSTAPTPTIEEQQRRQLRIAQQQQQQQQIQPNSRHPSPTVQPFLNEQTRHRNPPVQPPTQQLPTNVTNQQIPLINPVPAPIPATAEPPANPVTTASSRDISLITPPRSFVNGKLVPKEEDVIWCLEILAFVSKYTHIRDKLQDTKMVPKLRLTPNDFEDRKNIRIREDSSEGIMGDTNDEYFDDMEIDDDSCSGPRHYDSTHATYIDTDDDEDCQNDDEDNYNYDTYDFEADIDIAEEFTGPSINIFSLVELFTTRKFPYEVQYWAGVIMRNSCRKDDERGGIRQCASFKCGKWETHPKQFAKCRRCKRTKYCCRECQLDAWSFHRYWCVPTDNSSRSTASGSTASSVSHASHSHSSHSHNRSSSHRANAHQQIPQYQYQPFQSSQQSQMRTTSPTITPIPQTTANSIIEQTTSNLNLRNLAIFNQMSSSHNQSSRSNSEPQAHDNSLNSISNLTSQTESNSASSTQHHTESEDIIMSVD